MVERRSGTTGPDESGRAPGPVVAVVQREVAVSLVNISGSGCLVESRVGLEPGTVGTLRVMVDGIEYADLVRVARCGQIAGSATLHHVGLQFLWEAAPGAQALRRLGIDGSASTAPSETRIELRWSGGG